MGRLTRIEHVRSGPLFDVSRALLDGRPVFLKTVGERADAARRMGLASERVNPHPDTGGFAGRQGMGWDAIEDAPLEHAHYESLLRAELNVIDAARDPWNHPGAWLAHRRGDELVDADGAVCLVMPACEGTPLARLSRREQRDRIPEMLPALWRALSHCPHGDLNADDLLIDPSGRFFRILDPGVRIDGPSYETTWGASFESTLFTTNAAHYPILLPEHGPGPPRLRAPYAEVLVNYLNRTGRTDRAGGSASPAAADMVAVGSIYVLALTGAPLLRLLDLDAPLWTVIRVGPRNIEPDRDRCLEEIEGGGLLRSLRHGGATAREADLCMRLVALRVDSEEDLEL